MIAFILRRSDFKTAIQSSVIDYDLVLGSTGADMGTVNVLGKIGTEYVDSWIAIEKNIWIISKIEPSEKESKITLAPALKAFERPIHIGESAASAGAFVEAEIIANFREPSDTTYALPYLEIINNASIISYIAPQTDDNGYYNLANYINLLEAEFGLEIKFWVENKKLSFELRVRPTAEKTVFFETAEAQLVSQTFTNKATAKVTVIKDGISTDFYLSANGEISETPPAERAVGGWEVITSKGKDEASADVARSVFYKNIASHKIAFLSTRKFELYEKIKTNINGRPLQTKICFIGKSKKDKRYLYKCGELATTLIEKISRATQKGGMDRYIKIPIDIKSGGTGATTLEEAQINLEILKPADFVIEQGISGMWAWRKWSSGVAECWGRYKHTITSWLAWGYAFEGNPSFRINYPSIFVTAPILNIQCAQSGMGIMAIENYGFDTAQQSAEMFVIRPNSTSVGNIIISAYAIGRWK